MKINRPTLLLILAVLCALLATALAARWLQAQAADHTTLVVANADIPLGTPLEASMLTTLSWPPGQLPQGAAQDPGLLVGRVTRTAVARHEPLLESKLAALGARGGLSAAIAPGRRAITVKVNEVMGVAGFALPGALVDVMVNTQVDDSRHQSSSALSKIVLERILVLAVAQESARDANAPRVASAVTLEVTPEQAERLDLARSVGALSLVLRNPADHADAGTDGARKQDLLHGTPVRMAEAKPARPAPRRASSPPAARGAQPHASGSSPSDGDHDTGRTELIRGTHRAQVTW